MKKKKGFVFVETLIVVAVLTASLLMLYSSYSGIIQKEKTRLKYNDSVYLYRTYYLEKFFKNFRVDLLMASLNKEEDTKPKSMITSFGCRGDIFLNEEDNLGFCENLYQELHIHNLYFTYNDLSELQDCTDQKGLCEALVQVNSQAAEYLKTIGGNGQEGYRIIAEFAETKKGEACTDENNDCLYFYTTLSLGELT